MNDVNKGMVFVGLGISTFILMYLTLSMGYVWVPFLIVSLISNTIGTSILLRDIRRMDKDKVQNNSSSG